MAPAIPWSLAAVGAAVVTALSWPSLRHPASHGFFRFFALLALLCLVALSLPHWFERPRSLPQLLSWTLLAGSLFPAISGFLLLHRRGRPSAPDPGSPLMRFENTSALVTDGVYRFIRHPLYASLVLLAWGVALKSVWWLPATLALVATGFLVATAKAEEAENIARFGAAYRTYMASTRLFIPYVL